MKLNKVIAVPAIALAAGLGLSACGASAPVTAKPLPVITHTVPATTPAPTTAAPKPAPTHTVYVQPAAPAAPAPAAPAPVQASGGNCGGGVNAGPNTSCPFALNVAAAYNGPGADYENVYSTVTGLTYGVTYTMSTGNQVYATGGNNASVWFTW